MAVRATTPPTTPPTMGAMGVDEGAGVGVVGSVAVVLLLDVGELIPWVVVGSW